MENQHSVADFVSFMSDSDYSFAHVPHTSQVDMRIFTAPQLTIVANRNVYGNGDLSAICGRGGGELEGVARVQSTVCESVRTRREQGEDSL